jgi:hypothetical protein
VHIYLKAIVKLNEFYDIKDELPSLKPLNLAFLQSENFQQECEEKYVEELRFIGLKKSQFLQLCPGLDITIIAKYFQGMDNNVSLSTEELESLNQFFWNLYFANHVGCLVTSKNLSQ